MSTAILSHRTFVPTRATAPARSARPTPLRLTRRGRLVLGFLAAVPIAAVLAFSALSAPAVAGSEMSTVAFATVTVQPGESLWGIAERIAPGSDPREVITQIERLNALEGSAVAAGQSLAIPADYAANGR